MLNNIFDIEVRLDINKEFSKMVNYLHYIGNTTSTSRYTSYIKLTFIGAINSYAFKRWPYRGTAINCEEYLENIGLPEYYFKGNIWINEKSFLHYLEFIYNIYYFSYDQCYDSPPKSQKEGIHLFYTHNHWVSSD